MKLPEKFVERIKNQLNIDSDAFLKSLETISPISVRVNSSKLKDLFFKDLLKNKVEWCENSFYLTQRPSYTMDPLFHAGCYYPQEASSMYLWTVLNLIKPHLPEEPKILDLCAAPGGKSTLISTFLDGKGLMIANEVIQSRAQILNDNLTKWGAMNQIVTNADPKAIGKLDHFFDVIVIDAPCSGEGLFRKDQRAREEWSEANVQLCADRQKRIFNDVLPALKPGGFVVYSTCTYNDLENKNQVDYLIENLGYQPFVINQDQNICYKQFFPHLVEGEGFFIACLQKPNAEIETIEQYVKIQKNRSYYKLEELVNKYIDCKDLYLIQLNDHRIWAFPEKYIKDYFLISKRLKTIAAGVESGTYDKDLFLPEHALALSQGLKDSVQRIDLERDMCLKYLKKESLNIEDEDFKVGEWAVITYQNHALGWVKVLKNRLNNYLPKSYRILKDIVE